MHVANTLLAFKINDPKQLWRLGLLPWVREPLHGGVLRQNTKLCYMKPLTQVLWHSEAQSFVYKINTVLAGKYYIVSIGMGHNFEYSINWFNNRIRIGCAMFWHNVGMFSVLMWWWCRWCNQRVTQPITHLKSLTDNRTTHVRCRFASRFKCQNFLQMGLNH